MRDGDGTSMLFRFAESVVNIAHFSNTTQKNGPGAGVRRRDRPIERRDGPRHPQRTRSYLGS